MDTPPIHRGQTDDLSSASRVDGLLRPEVLAAFDRKTFERDGYWVWEGILTDAGRKQWAASLEKLQHMQDCILMDTDWASIDFQGRGQKPPSPEEITPEFLSTCCGGSEQMPRFLRAKVRQYMLEHGLLGPGPALVTRGFNSMGVMPEYFPLRIRRLHYGCHHRSPADDGAIQKALW